MVWFYILRLVRKMTNSDESKDNETCKHYLTYSDVYYDVLAWKRFALSELSEEEHPIPLT